MCIMFRSFFPVPSVIPITDIKGMEAAKYTKQEKQLRCKVASLYRIIDLNGWSYGIYNHISVGIPGNTFL